MYIQAYYMGCVTSASRAGWVHVLSIDVTYNALVFTLIRERGRWPEGRMQSKFVGI